MTDKTKQNLAYMKLASKFRDLIHRGDFLPGDKLPSIREVMKDETVSLATATHAYSLLEDDALIEARAQSGFYVTYEIPQTLDKSCHYTVTKNAKKIEIPDLVYRMISAASDKKMHNFGAATIDPEFLPNTMLNKALKQVIKENPTHSALYNFAPGNSFYRKAVQKKLSSLKIKAPLENIIATSGAMEAIVLSLKVLTKPGDTILIETPSYYGTLLAIQNLDLKILEVPTHPIHGIDLEILEKIISTNTNIKAALFISNFNNPMGSYICDKNKINIAKTFRENNIAIIEDDIYGDLTFNDKRPLTFKSFDDDNVIYCSSVSKTLSPGLRVGFMVVPTKFKEEVERHQFISNIGTNALNQMVVGHLLQKKFYDNHCKKLSQILKDNIIRFQKCIQLYFPEQTQVTNPEGGFFLWVKLPVEVDSTDLYNELIKKNIVISPGIMFSASDDYRNYIRLCTGMKWTDAVEKDLRIIGEHIKALTA
ncbi:transcriptional regulator, GntR family [Bacteriovorax sp. BSW11_IV]|uniref:aminotransferase-like domain-containing protein n=1 Tax=Bacteriovorax sp. BSW11_IV TaxID=1353529 RepID=UPI00038A005E|nr:PLP-dependent aminotransferase family protein [Bacteriovorax sp. BSW11_IV]EQC48502.1 transcriptional regulator, GntR family [Bacteriovorax sp. BSW11_IV]